MKAIVLRKSGSAHAASLVELPRPRLAADDEVLIRILTVGIDGTDREIIQDGYGDLPAGMEQMIIGHEMVGVIVEAGAASALDAGQLVTMLVRRPCSEPECDNCRNGRQDYCSTGRFVERGIHGADGFLCEYVVERAQYVVPVPVACTPFAVLVEPQSIVEKVWNQLSFIQQRTLWKPQTALVIGSGPLGLLAAATCRSMGIHTEVWSRTGAAGVKAELAAQCGAHYARAGSPADPQHSHAYDVIWECSGHSPFAFDAIRMLKRNGVLALLSVTPGNGTATLSSDELNQEMMAHNKCVIGSVNASRADFIAAIERLQAIHSLYPGLPERILTQTYALDEVPGLNFSDISVKAQVELVPQGEWGNVVKS